MVFIQRRGDADNNGVHVVELRIVSGGGESLRLGRLDFLRCDTVDVRTALGQTVDLARVDIEAGHPELLFAVQQSQGKSDVAKADDANAGLAPQDPGLELTN